MNKAGNINYFVYGALAFLVRLGLGFALGFGSDVIAFKFSLVALTTAV